MLGSFVLNTCLVMLAVLVHYEFLYNLSAAIPSLRVKHRVMILLGVFGVLLAHTVEIWIFAFGYLYMDRVPGWGKLEGNLSGELMDFVYFSFVTYTSLGYGDIVATGYIRYLTGVEALTGLVLVTWSASFLYFEMQRYWDPR